MMKIEKICLKMGSDIFFVNYFMAERMNNQEAQTNAMIDQVWKTVEPGICPGSI
jgi:hypothetical protein